MKKLKLILPLMLLLFTAFGNVAIAQKKAGKQMNHTTQEINFSEGKWADVSATAKKNKKYIFVDAYTTWCGPCKLLKSQTFKEKEVIEFFNKNLVNVTIDMEKGEGLTLAKTWGVTAYPTLLFFNPEGKLIMRQVGFVDGKKLVDIAKQSLKKM